MNEKRMVRRYWIRDINTELKERTAVTKPFEVSVADIATALSITCKEAGLQLLKKGALESKYQAWVIVPEVVNPFAIYAKKTPLD